LPSKADIATKQRHEDFATVFKGEAGERVLRHLMTQFSMFKSTHAPGAVALDVNQVIFHEGERNVVLYILSQMQQEKYPRTAEQMIDDSHLATREVEGI
jgi:hypothetical protein